MKPTREFYQQNRPHYQQTTPNLIYKSAQYDALDKFAENIKDSISKPEVHASVIKSVIQDVINFTIYINSLAEPSIMQLHTCIDVCQAIKDLSTQVIKHGKIVIHNI